MKKQDFTISREVLESMLTMDAELVQKMENSSCVTSDMGICIDWMRKQEDEVTELIRSGECTPHEAIILVAIRERGVEFGYDKEEVKRRCEVLGMPVVVYIIRKNFGVRVDLQVEKRIA